MRNEQQEQLEHFGLTPAEARVYLALLQKGGTLGASALAASTRLTRQNVYPILSSLADKGMVEAEAGYGSRFTAVAPRDALSRLVAREKQQVLEREQYAAAVVDQLELLVESSPRPTDDGASESLIEVIRDPRVVGARFEQLQSEAKVSIDVIVKAPIFVHKGNPTENKALGRGVRCRGLYEHVILDMPGMREYLGRWVAQGEEARAYRGELPHKLALFDGQTILMPLIRPGEQTKTVLIRHPQLGQSLTITFEHFWEKSEKIKALPQKSQVANEGDAAEKRSAISRLTRGQNGGQRHRRKKSTQL
jgi:sugar-specific transcriptional regulator TrmB